MLQNMLRMKISETRHGEKKNMYEIRQKTTGGSDRLCTVPIHNESFIRPQRSDILFINQPSPAITRYLSIG